MPSSMRIFGMNKCRFSSDLKYDDQIQSPGLIGFMETLTIYLGWILDRGKNNIKEKQTRGAHSAQRVWTVSANLRRKAALDSIDD